MTPLIVYADMVTPIGNAPPHLDALLLAEACRRSAVATITAADPPGEWSALPAIPLDRREIAGIEVSLCSSPQIMAAHGREMVECFAKRIDPTAAAMLLPTDQRAQICTTGTWTKSYYLPLRRLAATGVAWWAVGDAVEMRELLAGVISIGKKISQGHGRVKRWIIEPCDLDLSWFCGSQLMQLMRPLPWGDWLPADLAGYRRSFGSCVPPYWHPARFMEIVVPC